MSIGARVRACRKAAHLSQHDLATRIGATSTIVSRWERETSSPQVESCKALARVFDCSLDWLITGKGVPPLTLAERQSPAQGPLKATGTED